MNAIQQHLFAPLQPWLGSPPWVPDTLALTRQVAEAGLVSGSGLPLVLVPPLEDGLTYEERVWRTGQVETRPHNWHDYFNGLIWLAYPRAKAALNARHWASRQPERRGAARDALTHLDECGLLVTSSQPRLLELLRSFQWKRLFWDERQAVAACMGFHLFGHATYEQLLAPFRGLTAKAVLYEVEESWHGLAPEAQRQALDQRLAADIAAGRYLQPRELQPLPLLGIPGLVAENADPAYYDDAWQFRPGRRGVIAAERV